MFFYLNYRHNAGSKIKIKQIIAEDQLSTPEDNILYLQKGVQRFESPDTLNGELIILGDPVFQRKSKLNRIAFLTPNELREDLLYEEIKGHYYWFFFHEGGMLCGSSFGAIFPVYYHRQHDRTVVSSSSFFLAEQIGAHQRDKRNLLERLLFNYTFFDSTWWQEIKLLDAHSHLRFTSNTTSIERKFDLTNYFETAVDTSRGSLRQLSYLFEEEASLFLPDEPFGVSLTGGFDGRTLVAAAKKTGKEFITYSFGKPGISDVSVPNAQSKKLRVPYMPILLDQAYLNSDAMPSAKAFMEQTEFNGNFGRPHYHYAARLLAERVPYIITGNFGSELFRAMHSPGVMISRPLIRIFSATDDSWKDDLKHYKDTWTETYFDQELDSLIADLESYLGRMQGWDMNLKFYYFVYNEIFRKYFGPELIMQSHYLNNRTPYLNLRFIKELNKTIWSGIHARIFEKMLNKRMKGQMFYSSFIRLSNRKMYHLKTNKGYSPADVMEPWRLPILVGRVVLKKYIKNEESDNNAVEQFFIQNHKKISSQILSNCECPFIQSQIEKSIQDITRKSNLEHWIKFYSIASGWEATGAASTNLIH